MAFAYYQRLSRPRQRIYQLSDGIEIIRLPDSQSITPLTDRLEVSLQSEDQKEASRISNKLVAEICIALKVPRLKVRVLAKRPSDDREELHGLYDPRADEDRPAEITVWMRTAKRRQVVAFRTFLRTLLHELCHHLDYELLALEESFHTEGFYKRESSLFHQLVPKAESDPE